MVLVQGLRRGTSPRAGFDQFNSLHERLIEAWAAVGGELGGRVVFASLDRDAALEDDMTVNYLRDTAIQAGLETSYLAVKDLGWHAGRRVFTDLGERPIATAVQALPLGMADPRAVRPAPARRRRRGGWSPPGRWS